ncbi:protein-tyrosine phosphatase [Micromonospora pattaloongensis]|uniref:Protein-tyrosine phosphatase n=1 Tax=Micromonospora pattaloongensis TaxID=405436 RepID=A0A1H3Q8Y4_9ACTN|nr:tyrosine-protein phosphatase [Micromonospora pattaloongensis]SDZ09733.1 protein-tyrosine phosphatase [Micromonospora pattaloongensis]
MSRPGGILVGAPNSRDLGGLTGAGGRPVRSGMLIRSDAPGRLGDADVGVLAELGVTCVVDLRDASEISVAAPDRLAGQPRVVHLPVSEREHPVFIYLSAVLAGHDLGAYAALAREGTPAAMAEIYRWFVTGAPARAGFGRAVRLAADPANLPLLFHCSAGKDRTGWLTVILLTALGVDDAAIRADYLRSNQLGAGTREAILRAMRRRHPELDEDAVRPVLEVREEYLDAAYAEVARVYGSFDGYLRDGLGLDEATLTALRGHLLG